MPKYSVAIMKRVVLEGDGVTIGDAQEIALDVVRGAADRRDLELAGIEVKHISEPILIDVTPFREEDNLLPAPDIEPEVEVEGEEIEDEEEAEEELGEEEDEAYAPYYREEDEDLPDEYYMRRE